MANPFKHSNNPVREHIKTAEAGAEGRPGYWAASTHGRGNFFFLLISVPAFLCSFGQSLGTLV